MKDQNIIDLIAKSYKLYESGYSNLSEFFLKESEGLKNDSFKYIMFYKNLVSELEKLILNTYSNLPSHPYNPPANISDNELIEYNQFYHEMDVFYYNEYVKRATDNPEFYENMPNWETCKDSKKLREAMIMDFVKLEDPIIIISPSKEISKTDLVLRKSILLNILDEAFKTSIANGIHDIEDKLNLENNDQDHNLDIESEVRKAFNYTLGENDRNSLKILSQEDYENLVEWVTYYFENDLKMPSIEHPISKINTSKGNIFTTFKDLFKLLKPETSKPTSYFELIKKCFFEYRNDKISNIQKTKRPIGYNDLVK